MYIWSLLFSSCGRHFIVCIALNKRYEVESKWEGTLCDAYIDLHASNYLQS